LSRHRYESPYQTEGYRKHEDKGDNRQNKHVRKGRNQRRGSKMIYKNRQCGDISRKARGKNGSYRNKRRIGNMVQFFKKILRKKDNPKNCAKRQLKIFVIFFFGFCDTSFVFACTKEKQDSSGCARTSPQSPYLFVNEASNIQKNIFCMFE